jgi:quinol monooxygenase YgiN
MTEHDPNEIQLVATLTAKPGQETALRTALQSIIPEVLRERGCVEYAMHVDRKTASRVVMFERWADQEALDSHGAGVPFQSLAAQFDTLLAEPLEIVLLQRIG